MMGSRGIKSGHEVETLLRRVRRLFRYRAGTVKRYKRKFWKRTRYIAKREASKWADQLEDYQRG